ncbi:MAG: 4-phosphoerythronate dehydrogenase [Sedimentisphaerales bacterium]|nr:4-phosphoerythronate dehydrogenase [Sedimentisphaerales bacterium]
MKIVADENIPFAQQAFSHLGDVLLLPGRSLSHEHLKNADILLVRSITNVNSQLLDGTPVRFVGTATIGTDHIDLPYLNRRGIAFADAAGSNANSVAEYVITALLNLAQKHQFQLAGKSIGIVGLGNIGSKLEKFAQALKMNVIPNDPPLQRKTAHPRFQPLSQALQADFVTLHVPLTRTGTDPTWHLINDQNLTTLKPSAFLINSSRGPVVDNLALKNALAQNQLAGAVLDVWENEPEIDLDLLKLTEIATPHIAGYSFDGKTNGTALLHAAACHFLQIPNHLQINQLLPPPPTPQITLDNPPPSDQQPPSVQKPNATDQLLLLQAFNAIYNITLDDDNLRKISAQPPKNRRKFFDQLRKNYPIRREAPNTHVKLTHPNPALTAQLAQLGFQTN